MTDSDFVLLTTDTDKFMRDRGYDTVMEYASNHDITDVTVRNLIIQNVLAGAVKVGNKWYVPHASTYEKRKNYLHIPEGYMSMSDAARKWYMTTANVHILVKKGRVPGVIRIGTHSYIPEDAEIIEEAVHVTPDGYLTTKDLSEKWHFTRSYIRACIAEGKIPGVLTIKGRKYIPADAKMPERKVKGEAV